MNRECNTYKAKKLSSKVLCTKVKYIALLNFIITKVTGFETRRETQI